MVEPYNRLLLEAGDVIDYVQSVGGDLSDEAVAIQVAAGEQHADLPDDAVLKDYPKELSVRPQNVIRVSDWHEMTMAYKALGEVVGGILDPKIVWTDILHEVGHQTPAALVGFRRSALSIRVTKARKISTPDGEEWKIALRPFTELADPAHPEKLTKLALASIVAGPDILSDGDDARLHAMGYKDQQDVAQRIQTATDPRLSSLLLPAPFRNYVRTDKNPQ